jgi:hypothetical protein
MFRYARQEPGQAALAIPCRTRWQDRARDHAGNGGVADSTGDRAARRHSRQHQLAAYACRRRWRGLERFSG